MTKMWRGTLVLADHLVPEGAVIFGGGKILWAGRAEHLPEQYSNVRPATPPRTEYICPGFIDTHSHGGGGASFPDARSRAEVRRAALEHLQSGTTTLVASLVTAPLQALSRQARLLAGCTREGTIAGTHFEGPFLSVARRGAQDPRYITGISVEGVRHLLEAAAGSALSMTIAPEQIQDEEGLRALETLAGAGAIPSWGHTDSSLPEAENGIFAGIDVLSQTGRRATVTHLFNGMRPLHHRDPGPIPAFLLAAVRGQLVVELICDGVHLAPALVANIVSTAGRDNCVFVTDSMAAAGLPDGEHILGGRPVVVKEGIARLQGSATLAGGTAHLSDCVRVAVKEAGMNLVDAVFLAATQGARLFGWDDRGEIRTGRRADLVSLSNDLEVVHVVREGREV